MFDPIRDHLQERGLIVIGIFEVEKFDSGRRIPRLLALTDIFASFFDGNKQEQPFYWISIRSIVTSGQSMTLTFANGNMTFISPDSAIQEKIGLILKKLLPKSEFNALSACSLTRSKVSSSPRSVFSRFCGFVAFSGIHCDHRIVDFVFKQLMFSPSNLIIPSSDDIGANILALLFALRTSKIVHSITIPANEGCDLFLELSHFFLLSTHIHHFNIVNQRVTKGFYEFCKSLKDTEHRNPTGITISNAELGRGEMAAFYCSCLFRKFSSISLQSSISDLPYFYNSFLTPELTSNLKMINLDFTKSIQLSQLIEKIPNIFSLSLRGCGLEIGEAITSLSDLSNLSMVNLSENFCSKKPTLNLPHNLVRIDLNGVKWGDGTISWLFSEILKLHWQYGLKLSLSDIDASNSEWDSLQLSLRSAENSPMTHLSWNNNRIGLDFLKYISKCQSLRSLFVNSCFDNPDILQRFEEIITSLKSLSILSMKGSERKCLGFDSQFFGSLLRCKSLSALDISMNQIGDEGMQFLCQILANNLNLRQLKFDGSQMTSLRLFESLLDSAILTQRNIAIDWPSKDFESIGKVAEADLQRMRRKVFSILNAGEITESKLGDPFYYPFVLYKWETTDEFPSYIDESVEAIQSIFGSAESSERSSNHSEEKAPAVVSQVHISPIQTPNRAPQLETIPVRISPKGEEKVPATFFDKGKPNGLISTAEQPKFMHEEPISDQSVAKILTNKGETNVQTHGSKSVAKTPFNSPSQKSQLPSYNDAKVLTPPKESAVIHESAKDNETRLKPDWSFANRKINLPEKDKVADELLSRFSLDNLSSALTNVKCK